MTRATNGRRGRVLVVDDDPDIRALFQAVLSRDFFVEVAEDGWAALQRLNRTTFDAVVLDMAMPNKSGLSVLTEIRSDEHLKHTPVIVVSAVAADNDLWAGVKLEWDKYMQKPVSVNDLVKNVTSLVRKKPRKSVRKPAARAKPVASGAKSARAARAKPAAAAGKKAARAKAPATRSKPAKRDAAKKPAARKIARKRAR